jgi:hypothetical protein
MGGRPFEIRNLEALVHPNLETTDTEVLLVAVCADTHEMHIQVFVHKVILAHRFKKYRQFTEPEGSFPFSQRWMTTLIQLNL